MLLRRAAVTWYNQVMGHMFLTTIACLLSLGLVHIIATVTLNKVYLAKLYHYCEHRPNDFGKYACFTSWIGASKSYEVVLAPLYWIAIGAAIIITVAYIVAIRRPTVRMSYVMAWTLFIATAASWVLTILLAAIWALTVWLYYW